jgi:predicted GTPase
MNNDKDRLLSVIREIYGRVVWTHKTHEKERELSTRKAKRDKRVNVILMAITTTGTSKSLFKSTPL